MTRILGIVAIAVVAGWALDARGRTWTDATGKHTIEAELVGIQADEVELKRTSGKTVRMALDKLSAADQGFVRWIARSEPKLHEPLCLAIDRFASARAATGTGTRGGMAGARTALERLRTALAGSGNVRGQLQAAMVEYYIGQTFAARDGQRQAALQRAATAFDAIYQRYRVDARNEVTPTGLFAHLWHGKTLIDQGDLQTSVDVLDEVLANMPEPGQAEGNTTAAALFAQAQAFRLAALERVSPQDAREEAQAFLGGYRKWKETRGYRAVAARFGKSAASGPSAFEFEFDPEYIEGCFMTLDRVLDVPGS